jgi:hypothetical protein
LNTSQILGDKEQFAIRYTVPQDTHYDAGDPTAVCQLVIGGKLITGTGQTCFLPTWLFNLTDHKNRIADARDHLFPKEFEGKTNREIFELISKSNQTEEEFNPDFLYLPQLDRDIHVRHSFIIDPALGACQPHFYVKHNQICFLVDGKNCFNNDDDNGHFFYHTLPLEIFYNTIDEAIVFVTVLYPYLKENVSRRFGTI